MFLIFCLYIIYSLFFIYNAFYKTIPKLFPTEMKKKGNKQEVFNGLAEKTSGGLKKEDLILNKRGNIVSKKRSEQGAKQFKNIESFVKNRGKHRNENIAETANDAAQIAENNLNLANEANEEANAAKQEAIESKLEETQIPEPAVVAPVQAKRGKKLQK